MRYLISLLCLGLSVLGLAVASALAFPSTQSFLAASAPFLDWASLAKPVFGFDALQSAGVIAGAGILIGFIVNSFYFKLRTRRSGERYSILNMASGYFWGLVFVAVAALFVLLAYYTYADISASTGEGSGRRVKVHWVLALFYYGYFWLLDAIGNTGTALIALIIGGVIFLFSLGMVANGDDEEEDEEDAAY